MLILSDKDLRNLTSEEIKIHLQAILKLSKAGLQPDPISLKQMWFVAFNMLLEIVNPIIYVCPFFARFA